MSNCIVHSTYVGVKAHIHRFIFKKHCIMLKFGAKKIVIRDYSVISFRGTFDNRMKIINHVIRWSVV